MLKLKSESKPKSIPVRNLEIGQLAQITNWATHQTGKNYEEQIVLRVSKDVLVSLTDKNIYWLNVTELSCICCATPLIKGTEFVVD